MIVYSGSKYCLGIEGLDRVRYQWRSENVDVPIAIRRTA